MRTRVKICGLTTEADRDVAVEAGADAVGFIVDVPVDSHREISLDEAKTLIDGTSPFVTTVLVTMATSVDAALKLLERSGADAIQLHGDVTDSFVAELTNVSTRRVLAAVDPHDSSVQQLAAQADAIVLDNIAPDGTGGTGERTDWERVSTLIDELDAPVILAGGLDPTNAATAIDEVAPYALDVASGVEDAHGRKDPVAVEQFIQRTVAIEEVHS